MLVEDVNGEARVSSKVIAVNVGNSHKAVSQLIKKHLSHLEEFGKIEFEITPQESGQRENTFKLNEDQSTFLLTCMKNTDIVISFKKSLVKAFSSLKKQAIMQEVRTAIPFETQLYAVRTALDWLNVSDSSKLKSMQMLFESNGLDKNLLPMYTESKGTLHSCSTLLAKNNSPVKVVTFNKLLLAEGYLGEKERVSSKGIKTFKALTEKGLKYGENLVSPDNPKETAPQYYEEKFSELMGIILGDK